MIPVAKRNLRISVLAFSARNSQRFVQNQVPKPPPPPNPSLEVRTPSGPTGQHILLSSSRTGQHEVHEGAQAVNVGFNAPAGGPGPGIGGTGVDFKITRSPLADAAITTVIGIGLVFVGGIAYLAWYKKNVLDKIELAFAPGYDPALELATQHTPRKDDVEDIDILPEDYVPDGLWSEHLRRKEQDRIDKIVQGGESGHYFVLLGPKGSGKGTMILEAMSAIQADGVSMCDAHPNLEVFRLRLGKALNYEYNEDSQTGLFQRRDPREGGPALDIERALNKLEKVAIRSAARRGKPLVLIINNVHFFNNDDDGRNIILQLQQRAEAWAAAGILTMVFSSDDYWPFNIMRKSASRMHVLSIYDLDLRESIHACTRMRLAEKRKLTNDALKKTLDLVGGRLSYLNRVCRAKNMLEMATHLMQVETAWLMGQIGLIPDCDDDVMDEQKWSSCSWLLLQEFVNLRKEHEKEYERAVQAGEIDPEFADIPLPVIPYWKCRQIMTRTDFLEELDRSNIISIDINHNVRPDSMLILHAAKQVVDQDGFQEILDGVRNRIDEIESLHRTRELTFKDLEKGDRMQLYVNKGGPPLV